MTVGHELSSRVICFPNTVIVLSASGESRDICRQCPARGDRNRQGATLRVGQHRRRAPLQVTRRSRRITRRSHLPRRAAVATAAAPCSCYGLSSMARWAPTLLPSPTRVDLATALDHRSVACDGSPVGMLPKRHAEVPHACLTLSRHELPARLMRPRAACYGNRR